MLTSAGATAVTDRIERLFDSIIADFPIRSFLYWRLEQKNKDEWPVYEFIRDFNSEAPHNPPANMAGITKDMFSPCIGPKSLARLSGPQDRQSFSHGIVGGLSRAVVRQEVFESIHLQNAADGFRPVRHRMLHGVIQRRTHRFPLFDHAPKLGFDLIPELRQELQLRIPDNGLFFMNVAGRSEVDG